MKPHFTKGAETAMTDTVDISDVPPVTTRELVLALKLYESAGAALLASGHAAEQALRRVEQAFWQTSPRHRVRKVAVLLRFRSLLAACETRRIKSLIEVHGTDAVMQILAVTAKLRLNTRWGFNPQKLALAVEAALTAAVMADEVFAA